MEWSTKYSDKNGIEESKIFSDGKNLRITLRKVNFLGPDFDGLFPEKSTNIKLLESFTLNNGRLCNCKIECLIPIPVQVNEAIKEGKLLVYLDLGIPRPNGTIDKEDLKIILELGKEKFHGSGLSGWFEDELLEIQRKLPSETFIKACINCKYSDYSPCGHGMFGWMMCFRNLKQEYLKIRSKDEFWEIHDRYDRIIQETFLCNEFERRKEGAGYRG